MSISVIQKIARKGSDKEKIAAEVIKDPVRSGAGAI